MLLLSSKTSPFARKVRVAARVCGLGGAITERAVNPYDPDSEVPQYNPLGLIPTLVRDDGEVLYESNLICAYLDSLHDGEPLIPAAGEARWRVLKLEALADGMMTAAVDSVVENKRRPAELYWAEGDARLRAKVTRALDALEAEPRRLDGDANLGRIAVACALGYLDLRLPSLAWREGRPSLAAWFETFADAPAMRATDPGA